jgi:two-component system sensor histidine kinase UhpB
MIYGVINSDRNIYRIEVLDSGKKEITHVENVGKAQPEPHYTELPIQRNVVWANIVMNTNAAQNGVAPPSPPAEHAKQVLGYVRVTMTHSYLLSKQKVRFGVELLMSMLALAISACLAWYLSASLTAPLREAIESLRTIRAGRFDQKLKVSTGGEVGELQHSINEMADGLQQAHHDLEAKVEVRTRELHLSRNQALKADAEKRRLIHKVNTIVEAERQSIAVEIHDELNASLIAVRLESERIARIAAKAEVEANPAAFADIQTRAKTVVEMALNLYANGRNLVRRLRPEVLEVMGLQGAIEEMLRLYNDSSDHAVDSLESHDSQDSRNGINAPSACHFEFAAKGEFTNLNPEIAISAYRIVQEACSNILKHAQARHARISIALASQLVVKAHVQIRGEDSIDGLYLDIEDDGRGFDTEQGSAGIGLSGMRERVAVVNGRFELRSTPGAGCQIHIFLPIDVKE